MKFKYTFVTSVFFSEITDDHLVAQSMIFLVAGLDVLKSSIILALMELARNKSVLDKVKQEVDSTIEKYKEFSFEAIKDMKYLEMCIKGTMDRENVHIYLYQCRNIHSCSCIVLLLRWAVKSIGFPRLMISFKNYGVNNK